MFQVMLTILEFLMGSEHVRKGSLCLPAKMRQEPVVKSLDGVFILVGVFLVGFVWFGWVFMFVICGGGSV